MDIVTKKKLNILIQLAEADKHFAKSEREMIFRIASDRKFPEDIVNSLIRNPEPIETLGALSIDQKFDYLITCVDLIFVDQKVFESEVIFARGIAIKLGFKKNVIDFLLENNGKKPLNELKSTIFELYS
ncbi:MAG: TerB family tellurite resistance protein [Cyclobacteriaceae bacterium]|jgi:hypothetical protein|nr:TerB family tellurite resistance protein [Cyclobacteriaceae bacterium]